MNNYEHYKEKLEIILNSNTNIAIDIVTNEIVPCKGLTCIRCLFSSDNNDGVSCYGNTIKWLLAEYREPEIDWSKVAVDTPVLVSSDGVNWYRRYFADVDDDGTPLVFADGRTSWTHNDVDEGWNERFNYTKLAEVSDEESK